MTQHPHMFSTSCLVCVVFTFVISLKWVIVPVNYSISSSSFTASYPNIGFNRMDSLAQVWLVNTKSYSGSLEMDSHIMCHHAVYLFAREPHEHISHDALPLALEHTVLESVEQLEMLLDQKPQRAGERTECSGNKKEEVEISERKYWLGPLILRIN